MRATKTCKIKNSKLSTYIKDQRSGNSHQELEDFELILFHKKIYARLTLRRRVLYWCHFYLNHPGGIRPANKPLKVYYRKVLMSQVELYIKTSKKCQHFKKRKTIYEYLPPMITAALKPWNFGADRPDIPIRQVNKTASANRSDHKEEGKPHLNDNDWSCHSLDQNFPSTLIGSIQQCTKGY